MGGGGGGGSGHKRAPQNHLPPPPPHTPPLALGGVCGGGGWGCVTPAPQLCSDPPWVCGVKWSATPKLLSLCRSLPLYLSPSISLFSPSFLCLFLSKVSLCLYLLLSLSLSSPAVPPLPASGRWQSATRESCPSKLTVSPPLHLLLSIHRESLTSIGVGGGVYMQEG